MKIYSKNEYSHLKSIIVGSSQNFSWPKNDLTFTRSIMSSTFQKTLSFDPLPDYIIKETEEDLDRLEEILKKNKIEVHRPVIDKPHWCYSVRDILLTVGNKIIQCPTPYDSRANEAELYPYLSSAECEWIQAPRPQTKDDPMFDAANVCKFDDKLLYLVSNTGNRAGAEWLQQEVGTEFEVIVWEDVYAFAHIDSTIASLNKDTILLNASRVSYNSLPLFLRQHRKIWINDIVSRDFYQFPFASKWIGLNILSIDPETVIVDSIQKKLIDRLKDVGFRVIELELRHSRTLGGGFHCVTLDLERE